MNPPGEEQGVRRWLSVLALLAVASVASAQQEPKSCDVQLSEAQITLELLERTSKQERQQAAADLVRWLQRAQAAEKRLAQVTAPPAPTPEAPKAEGQQ